VVLARVIGQREVRSINLDELRAGLSSRLRDCWRVAATDQGLSAAVGDFSSLVNG